MMRHARAVALMLLACTAVSADRPTDGIRGDSTFDASYRARYATRTDSLYKSPINLALSPDGRTLWVVCERSAELLRIDTRSREVTGAVAVGRRPLDLAVCPTGERVYVTNRWDNTLSVVSTSTLSVERELPTGNNPHGIVCDASSIYVTNMASDNVSVIDAATGETGVVLPTGHQPFDAAITPDGSRVAVTSQLAPGIPFRATPFTEITLIDGRRHYVTDHRRAENCVIQQGAAWTPDGAFALAATEVPRNLIPETQIYQGWMVTYGIAVAEARAGGTTAYLLIDDMNRYYADPFGIVCSPDGKYVYLGSSGVDVVNVLDWEAIERVLGIRDGKIGIPPDVIATYSRHLGMSDQYVVARIPVGKNPKGLAISPDGRWLYTAQRLDDTIGIIDTRTNELVDTIDLGGPDEVTELRYGEYLFNYASISFQQQLSCNTCHPENLVDGLIYDIAADGGMGRNLVDNRTMRGVAMTAPFKWSAKNPTIQRQEGPRAAQLFFRSHGFEPDGVEAISHFIESLPLAPNHHLRADGVLTPAQRRGQVQFERSRTNTGEYIPIANRCVTCHPAPLHTDRRKHNIGSQFPHDTNRNFDTPQLNRVYDTSPYLHDGRCWSLEEIWTVFNPDDLHGQTNDMTKEQLNDLIEYMKTF